MTVDYVRYTISAERHGAALDASPHCQAYELAHGIEDPASYVLRIEWTSRDGHMLGFRKCEEFRSVFVAVHPYVSDIAEMRHYRLTSVGRRKLVEAAGALSQE